MCSLFIYSPYALKYFGIVVCSNRNRIEKDSSKTLQQLFLILILLEGHCQSLGKTHQNDKITREKFFIYFLEIKLSVLFKRQNIPSVYTYLKGTVRYFWAQERHWHCFLRKFGLTPTLVSSAQIEAPLSFQLMVPETLIWTGDQYITPDATRGVL